MPSRCMIQRPKPHGQRRPSQRGDDRCRMEWRRSSRCRTVRSSTSRTSTHALKPIQRSADVCMGANARRSRWTGVTRLCGVAEFAELAANCARLARGLRKEFSVYNRLHRAHCFALSHGHLPPETTPIPSLRKSASWAASWAKSSSSWRARRSSIWRRSCACWRRAAAAGDAQARARTGAGGAKAFRHRGRRTWPWPSPFISSWSTWPRKRIACGCCASGAARSIRPGRHADARIDRRGAERAEGARRPGGDGADAPRQALHRAGLHRASDRGQAPHHAQQAAAAGAAPARSRGADRGRGDRHRRSRARWSARSPRSG